MFKFASEPPFSLCFFSSLSLDLLKRKSAESLDFDKLVFEVETNGAMAPDDAIALAARILQDQLQPFINFDEPEAQQDQTASEKLSFNSNLLKKVEELELSERPRNCLKRAQIDTVGQLLEKSAEDLMTITNFGQKSLDEIYEKLNARGLSLRVRG